MTAGVTMYEVMGQLATLLDPGLPNSYLISRSNALFNFPLLRESGLKAALLYYDGQQNDARVNMSIAQTASVDGYLDGWVGATLANHVKVHKITVNKEGQADGVVVTDELTGEKFSVKAKAVVNCGGPFSDEIRALVDGVDKETMRKYIVPAMGAHITLPRS